jgi:hypothetical protein
VKERGEEEEMGREIHFLLCLCHSSLWNPIEALQFLKIGGTMRRRGESIVASWEVSQKTPG